MRRLSLNHACTQVRRLTASHVRPPLDSSASCFMTSSRTCLPDSWVPMSLNMLVSVHEVVSLPATMKFMMQSRLCVCVCVLF